MTDRRYTDAEIAEIFRRAAASQPLLPDRTNHDGLSLSQLQEIGREVGIPVDRVANAAYSLEQVAQPVTRTLVGLPIGVRDSVDLDRRLSDAEWDQMVIAARECFSARGTLRQEGEFRQWTNGHLAMMLEPTPTGHRIRLQTRNGQAEGLMRGGMLISSFGVAMAAAGALTTSAKAAKFLTMGSLFLGMGLIAAAAGAARLPGWARRRREQMGGLVAKAQHMIRVSTSP
ncbi:MAG: hypothetical protein ABJC19_04680 [Gemmatimonadota bacterium]